MLPSNVAGRRPVPDIVDLRSALAFLASIPSQLVSTSDPVDPVAELAPVYKEIGAGTPVAPPTRIGPFDSSR